MASANKYIKDDKEYDIEIIRKNNKNTYIRVRDSKIIVTTNYFTKEKAIEKLINDNRNFIDKCLLKEEIKREDTSFKLFGNNYDIVYGFPTTEIDNNKIYTKDEKALNKYLSKYILQVYNERLEYNYNLFEENIPYPNLKIRKMTTRWGVCNTKTHTITLNLELSKYKMIYLDYVIIHELSHLVYPNHSKDFWNLVGKYCSNYKEIRKSMRLNT